jgi:subtilase family serine protease
MSGRKTLVAAVGATAAMVGMSLAAVSISAAAASRSGSVLVAGSATPWAASGRVLGQVAPSAPFSVDVWLRSDVAAATRFADAVSSPGSASREGYLSPRQYTARFGPSVTEARAVAGWLHREGFTAVSVDPQRAYVSAAATTVVVDRAFNVQENLYRATKTVNAGPYALRSNDRSVSLPTSLSSSVLGVTGLTNVAPTMAIARVRGAQPLAASADTSCSQYYGQKRAWHEPTKIGKTNFPFMVCGYSAKQLRAAYGANRVNTGKGVKIAVTELGLATNMYGTLVDYAQQEGMPAPVPSRYRELSIGRGTACGDIFQTEEQLDVEAVYDMAYQSNLLVVGGDSCAAQFGLDGLFNADETVLDGNGRHPLVSIDSNSWESNDEQQPASWTNIEHAFLLRAAGEGVSMLFSSGDASGLSSPSNDPFATAVGGTTLGLGHANGRLFETGWSNYLFLKYGNRWRFGEPNGAAGGGTSLVWAEPGYQVGVVPTSLSTVPGNKGPSRAVPDISADADPFTGMLVGTLYGKNGAYLAESVGGTSEATPLVAGMVAAAEQRQSKPFGFLNPVLYQLAATKAVHDALPLTASSRPLFKAVVCPTTPAFCQDDDGQVLALIDAESKEFTAQVTLKGYDTMTGIGTPNGEAFIDALRRLS